MPCLCKQCRSRSAGFWRSQQIWICTFCHLVCGLAAPTLSKTSDWLKIRSGRDILIYSAREGLIYSYIRATTWKTYLLRQTKTQIDLRIRAVCLESSLSAWRNFVSLATKNAHSEDSDQTARMRSLIWIFAGRTCPKARICKMYSF